MKIWTMKSSYHHLSNFPYYGSYNPHNKWKQRTAFSWSGNNGFWIWIFFEFFLFLKKMTPTCSRMSRESWRVSLMYQPEKVEVCTLLYIAIIIKPVIHVAQFFFSLNIISVKYIFNEIDHFIPLLNSLIWCGR